MKTRSIHAAGVRPFALLTWLAVAGCATESGVAPSPAPVTQAVAASVEPPVDVPWSDVQRREVHIEVGPTQDPPRDAARHMELRVRELECEFGCFELDRELAVIDKYSCVFYPDVGKRPVSADPAAQWHVTKDDLDRLSAEIDDTRAGIADPADRTAFDIAVTDRFRAVRAKIEEMTR